MNVIETQSADTVQQPVVQPAVTAFVVPLSNRKFVCIAHNIPVAKSANDTYFAYHYISDRVAKLGGIEIDKFVYLKPDGRVDRIDIVSRAAKVISRMLTKPSKSERKQLRTDSKGAFGLAKELSLKLVA